MARTFASIVAEVAARSRYDINDAAKLARVQGWVNDVIQDLHGRHDWYWTLDRQIVQTASDKTDGTVSVAAAGTAVTGSSTAFASSDVGSFIQFTDDDNWYRITAVASATSLTIENGYAPVSSLVDGNYTIRKVFYALPSAEKVLSVKQAQTLEDVITINHRDFDVYLAFSDETGPTKMFCVYGLDSSQQIQFNIWPHADEIFNLEIKYKKKAVESDVTLIPEKWRHVLIDGALARAYEFQSYGVQNFDRRAIDEKVAAYERGIARMLADAEPDSGYTPTLQNRDLPNKYPIGRLPGGLSIPQD